MVKKKRKLSANAICFIIAGALIVGFPVVRAVADTFDINSHGTLEYSSEVKIAAEDITNLAEQANRVISALGGTPLTINTTSP